MGLSHSLAFWLQTPFFWVVFGVLMLGLEMINRRLIYFLPGSLAAMTLAILLVLSPQRRSGRSLRARALTRSLPGSR